jgi:hypothetical protein
MGVSTSEVGYTSATTGRGIHEVHRGHVVTLEKKILRVSSRMQGVVFIYKSKYNKYMHKTFFITSSLNSSVRLHRI